MTDEAIRRTAEVVCRLWTALLPSLSSRLGSDRGFESLADQMDALRRALQPPPDPVDRAVAVEARLRELDRPQ